ncbi:MAG: hypothetical protein HYU66_12385, partial [Armatimonadetes bacterium]|nr:hypothetical protein [Armatimonadota bacterium]
RVVATAEVAGRQLTEDATAVAATFELGDPDRWGGATDPGDDASRAVFDLLRLGLHRLPAARAGGPTGDEARLLLAVRRARGVAQAALPQLADPAALTQLVRRYGGQVAAWELAAEPAAEAVRAGDRRAAAFGPGGAGALVRLGAEAPETGGGAGLAALVARARGAEQRPVGVLAQGWVAEPWDRSLAASPAAEAAAQRVTPLEQAAYVARAVLLARAAGAAWFAYAGELARDDPEHHSLAEVGLRPDLCAYDGDPLPALAALDQAMDRSRGRSLGEAVKLARGVTCLRWAGRRPLASLWHQRDPAAAAQVVPSLAPGQVRAVDLFGRELPLRAVVGGVAVPVTSAPVYLEPYRLESEPFAAALRGAVLTGLPTVEARLVPLEDGIGVRLENTGNHSAAGRVRFAGGEEAFEPLPPQSTREIRFAGPAPDWGVDATLRVTADSGGESFTTTRLVRRLSCPRGGTSAGLPVARLVGGMAVEPNDLVARCGAAWDASGVRLRVEVTDDQVTAGDAVEVLLTAWRARPRATR